MFGYIVPEKPEMKIREYELFRAYYCGICKSIGKRYGHLKRLILRYDSAFLAVLLSAVANERIKLVMNRCVAHPVHKRHMAVDSGIIDYASDINVLMAYYNLEDKKRDNGSVASSAAMVFFKRAYEKIKKRYPEKVQTMEERLNDLVKLEKRKCASMDEAAEPFAKLMEEVVAYEPLCTGKNERVLRWIGYNLGKWIYLLDAYDDIEKDIAGGKYNPLVYQFKYGGEDIAGFKEKIRGKAEFNLTYSLNEISRGFELLDVKMNKGILQNIIYIGMLRKTENILGMGSCSKFEKSV
ncbi:MAG: DUF5685 family protein [Bacillota bacterium]